MVIDRYHREEKRSAVAEIRAAMAVALANPAASRLAAAIPWAIGRRGWRRRDRTGGCGSPYVGHAAQWRAPQAWSTILPGAEDDSGLSTFCAGRPIHSKARASAPNRGDRSGNRCRGLESATRQVWNIRKCHPGATLDRHHRTCRWHYAEGLLRRNRGVGRSGGYLGTGRLAILSQVETILPMTAGLPCGTGTSC